MIIDFRKVNFSKKELKYSIDNITIDGTINKKNRKVVLLEGRLFGHINSICDKCGDDFSLNINEELKLELYNGEVSLEESSSLDIIECFNEKINIDEIIESEIESIKLSLNYCNKCKKEGE